MLLAAQWQPMLKLWQKRHLNHRIVGIIAAFMVVIFRLEKEENRNE